METNHQETMLQLSKDFYNLTNIKTCIYDADGNELCYYPEKFSSFCSLVRQNEELDRRCKECDRHAFSVCKKTHKQHVYICHAGLLECVSPILHGEQIVGYIAIGQIKPNVQTGFLELEESKTIPQTLQTELAEEFQKLPAIHLEKLRSAMRILDACAGYEYLKNFLHDGKNQIDKQLDRYINERLADDLSVQKLCAVFRLSHNEVYSIFKEYFDSTPADYVKHRRLQHACALLKSTDFPVNKIAKLCGIPDYNYFSKIFKRYFQKSPREFRKHINPTYE